MNLMKKMMLRMTVLILIPVLLIGAGSYTLASKALKEGAQREAQKMTKLHGDMIQERLETIQRLVKLASANENLVKVLNADAGIEKSDIQSYLQHIKAQNPSLVEMLALVDPLGRIVVTDTKSDADLDISKRAYFKETIVGEESVLSDVLMNKETGNASIVVTAPLMEAGQLKGVLIGTITFDSIKSIVSDIEIGSEGYGYLIDKEGVLLAHPDASKENTYNLYTSDNETLNAILDHMTQGGSGDGFYTFDGEYKYIAYTSVNNWGLASTANYDDYMASAIEIRNLSLLIALSALIVSMISAYVMTRFGLVKPIHKLVEAMLKAGEGDLTARTAIKTKDEVRLLGDTFNEMMVMQGSIISEIRNASQDLMGTAEELSASAEETTATSEEITAKIDCIAGDAYNQSLSVEDANKAFEKLLSCVTETGHMTASSNAESQAVLGVAEEGRNLIKETVVSIHEISESTDATVGVLDQLNDTAKEVSGISTTINGVADSINLLALNASIEAARAGEHGRGFTVVAEEVRKLAEQTSNESREIQTLLSDILKQVQDATLSINATKSSVDTGVETVSQVDGMFTEIINSIEKVVERITTISESSHHESELAEEMNQIVLKVAEMANMISSSTQDIAAGAEEQAAVTETMAVSAESTSTMAESLNEMVSHFKIQHHKDILGRSKPIQSTLETVHLEEVKTSIG